MPHPNPLLYFSVNDENIFFDVERGDWCNLPICSLFKFCLVLLAQIDKNRDKMD